MVYVSSLTRNNPYVNQPPGGCTLDGLDRTRLLKDLRVKMQDVAPDHEVGHIALSDAKGSTPDGLASGRLYAGS